MTSKKKSISKDDMFNLNLLGMQKAAVQLIIFSDLLSYNAVLEGEEVIMNKYADEDDGITAAIPDVVIIQSLYIFSIAKVMLFFIGVSRYNFLYNKTLEGEWDLSLWPNAYVNFNNILGLTGLGYAIDAAFEFYNRDVVTPIFGIR